MFRALSLAFRLFIYFAAGLYVLKMVERRRAVPRGRKKKIETDGLPVRDAAFTEEKGPV